MQQTSQKVNKHNFSSQCGIKKFPVNNRDGFHLSSTLGSVLKIFKRKHQIQSFTDRLCILTEGIPLTLGQNPKPNNMQTVRVFLHEQPA